MSVYSPYINPQKVVQGNEGRERGSPKSLAFHLGGRNCNNAI